MEGARRVWSKVEEDEKYQGVGGSVGGKLGLS